MDNLTAVFGEPEELEFFYSTDMEDGGDWNDLDPLGHGMPFITVIRRTDGIHGIRIRDNELVVFVDNMELTYDNLAIIAAEAIKAVYGQVCTVNISF